MRKSIAFVIVSRVKVILFAAILLSVGALVCVTRQASAQPQIVVPIPTTGFDRFNSRVVRFDARNPGTFTSNVPLQGLNPGEQLVCADVRPLNRLFYGVGTNGSQGRFLQINPQTGVAQPVGSPFTTPTLPTNTFYGCDFDPLNDLFRVVSFTDLNFLLSPETGQVQSVGLNLTYPTGGPNPSVDELAYTNNFPGAQFTTLFGGEAGTASLVRIGGVGGNPSPNTGLLTTIGPFNIGSLFQSPDMDIGRNGTLFVGYNNGLYTVNPTTGQGTAIGGFPPSTSVDGFALDLSQFVPDPPFILTAPDPVAADPDSFDLRLFEYDFNTPTPLTELYSRFNPRSSPNDTQPVSVTLGRFNDDAIADIAVATSNGSTSVRVLNGDNGALLGSFSPFQGPTGGLYVAAGDVNNDGFDDVVVGAGPGGGPHVRVFSGSNLTVPLADFFAYPPNSGVGVRVAVADINKDGFDDIVTGPTSGLPSTVKVFSGQNLMEILSFDAYPGFQGGLFVAAADINRDGSAEIILGPGSGIAPTVTIFDGITGSQIASFFAFDQSFTGGVYVSSGGDFNTDGFPDIAVAGGPSPPPLPDGLSDTAARPDANPGVRIFSGATRAQIASFSPLGASFNGGINIAARGLPPGPTLPPFGNVSGVVSSVAGAPLRNAIVTITDPQNVTRTTVSSTFGTFSFDNVKTGEMHTLRASTKRYRFQARDVVVTGDMTGINFTGQEQVAADEVISQLLSSLRVPIRILQQNE